MASRALVAGASSAACGARPQGAGMCGVPSMGSTVALANVSSDMAPATSFAKPWRGRIALPQRRAGGLAPHTPVATPHTRGGCVACVASASGDGDGGANARRGAAHQHKLVTSIFETLPLKSLSAATNAAVLVSGRSAAAPAIAAAELPTASDAAGAAAASTSASASASASAASIPPSQPIPQQTVYSLRFRTGFSRGSGLTEPYAAVNVLLVGADGAALLHRVAPVNDPVAAAEQMRLICESGLDASVGVNCTVLTPPRTQTAISGGGSASGAAGSLAPAAAAASAAGAAGARSSSPMASSPYFPPSPRPGAPKARFQDGQVDEVAFLAAELGPLAGVLVGVERGMWRLEELDVSSSATGTTERFVCRDKLGCTAGLGAVWLPPVPAEAVVYGSGESAVLLTHAEAAALRDGGMEAYASTKRKLLAATFALTAGGSGVAGLIGGPGAALPFAIGGAAGLLYQLLLQVGVDVSLDRARAADAASLSSTVAAAVARDKAGAAAPVAPRRAPSNEEAAAQLELLEDGLRGPTVSDIVRGVASSPAVRLGFVAGVALLSVSSLSHQGLVSQAVVGCEGVTCAVGNSARDGVARLLLGVLGFLSYKVALVGVSLDDEQPRVGAPGRVESPSKQYTKEEKY